MLFLTSHTSDVGRLSRMLAVVISLAFLVSPTTVSLADESKSKSEPAAQKKDEASKPGEKQADEPKKSDVKKSELKKDDAKKPEAKKDDVKKPDGKKDEPKKDDGKKPEKKPDPKKDDAKKPEPKKTDDGKKPDEPKKTEDVKKVPAPVLDEQAALEFAQQHHPELADLLATLKKSDKQQYVNALRDLDRDRDRHVKLAERDQERAKASLEVWKMDSRIRLELAKFTMTQEPEREARIRELLKQRHDARLALLMLDKKRLAGRASKVDEQIAALQDNGSDAKLAAEFDRLMKSVKPKAAKPVAAPAKTAPKAANKTETKKPS